MYDVPVYRGRSYTPGQSLVKEVIRVVVVVVFGVEGWRTQRRFDV